jgi:hypothetical protein
MTAFIIAKYVEKGKLNWNTKFFDLFPSWKSKSKPEYAKMTFRIYCHTELEFYHFKRSDPQIPDFRETIFKKENSLLNSSLHFHL